VGAFAYEGADLYDEISKGVGSVFVVGGALMETRLTLLLMILAQSVLPKAAGIWVQLSTIRSHRMLTSTIGSKYTRV
jgi:hypothetical protein